MTDDLSDGAIWLSATLTVEQHQARPGQSYAPGTCAQCTPTDCRQLRWAEAQIERIRRERSARVKQGRARTENAKTVAALLTGVDPVTMTTERPR